MLKPSEEEIRIRAYQKSQSRIQKGEVGGEPQKDWIEAEEELIKEYSTLKGQFKVLIQRTKKSFTKRQKFPILQASNYEKWTLLLSSTSIIVTISGFYFAISSLEEQSKALSSSAYANLMDKQFEVNKMFIEKPYIRQYFYDNKTIKKTKCTKKECDYEEIIATADYIIDYFDLYWTQIQYVKDEDIIAWTNYIQDSFTKSSILCTRFN